MKRKNSFLLAIVSFLIFINLNVGAQQNLAENYYEKDFASHQASMVTLSAKVNSLEKELEEKNRYYLSHLGKSKEMEYELVQVQEQIKKQEEHLSTLTRKISKTWQDYLATQMGTQKTVIRMQQKKVYAKAIDTMVQNFSKLLAQKDQTQADFFKMKEKFKVHQKKEEILLSLVADMEGRREQVESSLNKEKMTLDEIEAKKELLPRGQKTVLKASHETWEDFELPFKSGLQSKKKLKGLSLEYVRQESLRTPAEGIVEYVGPLAVYGQVIMVDHGAKIRSIMLGEIESFVVAGNKVHKGQTIGTTKGQKGELYFEIRRENMAQNIMAWAHKKQKS